MHRGNSGCGCKPGSWRGGRTRDTLRAGDPDDYVRRSKAAMADHVRAMLAFGASGSVTFDYGNNIRAFAQEAGVADAFDFPGFVPAYIRPLFCEGKGPFRVAALSGDANDIAVIDRALAELFPDDEPLFPFWENVEARPIHWTPDWPPSEALPPIFREWFRFQPQPVFDDPWVDASRTLIAVDILSWPAASRSCWTSPLSTACASSRGGRRR